jgi:putative ABC transport system permease protein
VSIVPAPGRRQPWGKARRRCGDGQARLVASAVPPGPPGAGLGLAGAAWFAGQLPARLLAIAAAAVVAGAVITAAAALLPAALLRRLPAAHLLAEE